jgi:hypothetical protein
VILEREVFGDRKHARYIRIVIEPMKLGLLTDEFFSSSFDGDEVGQVEPEEENGLISCLLLELIDRLLRLLLRTRRDIHFGAF